MSDQVIPLPQPASNRTTRLRNTLKQGVVRVPRVERKLIMGDGTVKDWKDLTPDEKKAFVQKVMDEFIVPLARDLVIQDLQRERKAAN